MQRYGLIGEKLGHSYSKKIHEQLCTYTYDLIPLSQEEFPKFMALKSFTALNVTIPYKEKVIPYCDWIDKKARSIGAVNTLVHKDGKLYGYNTDYDGFLYLLKKNHIHLKNKKILILGTGGTSKTVAACARDLGAGTILFVSRRKKDNVITYQECSAHPDTEIIINTTPCGMYPNTGKCLLPLDLFPKCTDIVDVIYNPLKTELLLQGEKRGIHAVNGLEMLVAQAKFAAEYFIGLPIENSQIHKIRQKLLRELTNIVLIGMPGCGKTSIGKKIAKQLQKTFIDTDAFIVKKTGMPISQIFEQYGESYFRQLEAEVVSEVSKNTGQVIATGGGVIKREENIYHLKQNGLIFFINRDVKLLQAGKGRPLSSDKAAIWQLFKERYPLYKKYADIRINNNNFTTTIRKVMNKYDEYFSH